MAQKKTINEKKKKTVEKLASEIKASKTILLVSIKDLPCSQLQKIKKDLREKASVRVVKRSLLLRAVDDAKLPGLEELKKYVTGDMALALSNEDAFEISAWLCENRNPISAKQGQIVEEDIRVEPGPTDLMPGPAISELGAVGLKVGVEEGKIAIKVAHTLVKKGQPVTEAVASILQKLNIKPFMIGLNPVVVYDRTTEKVYANIKIDKKQTISNLLLCYSKALGFSRNITYYSKETIGYLLAKANSHFLALEKLNITQKKDD